jgi:hypothetical protein
MGDTRSDAKKRYWAQFSREERKSMVRPRENFNAIRYHATKRPTRLDIAWAAGVFEGEGNAHRSQNNERVVVVQKDRWLCDELQNFFGGGICSKARDNGIWPKTYFFQWQLSGKRAEEFLLAVYPFLSPRRKRQVEVTLEREVA